MDTTASQTSTDTIIDLLALKENLHTMIVDATSTCFHADETEEIWSKPPPEWFDYEESQGRFHDGSMLFRHLKQLYGRHHASQEFNECVGSVMVSYNFDRRIEVPCLYVNKETGVSGGPRERLPPRGHLRRAHEVALGARE